MLANKCHRDDNGYCNPWMLRSSHRLLLSTAHLTQPAILSKKEETVQGEIQEGTKVVFQCVPPLPHSVSDAHQLRKEGVIVSYPSTETLPHAWDANEFPHMPLEEHYVNRVRYKMPGRPISFGVTSLS